MAVGHRRREGRGAAGTKAVIDLPNRTETGSGFSGLARSVCRIRIQFHETYNKPFSRRFTVINQDGGRRRCSFNIYSGTVITQELPFCNVLGIQMFKIANKLRIKR